MRTPMESLRKGLVLLECICSRSADGHGVLLGELAGAMGWKRTTTHNLAKTLVLCGFAENRGDGRYRPGWRLRDLTRSVFLVGQGLRGSGGVDGGSAGKGIGAMTDQRLTARAKGAAYALGVDLVGVGNIERWEACPPLMSPRGIMPTARSVLVCAIHHTDGMIEMGGESSPHDQGSYAYQLLMNDHLDVISYSMGRFFEEEGYRAVPITASNIWRYRPYKTLRSTFAPDMSHIYAAVASGLAELGYNGLAMTPEFGARNRFVSIITDAPLVPTPLLPGDTLCDRCNLCVTMCPTLATSAEVRGTTALEIEGRTYRFADKNLWRCAWAEHFGLSVDLDIPPEVTEETILRHVGEHGLRGGTMGYCLKFCLPKARRSWNKAYSSAPIRRKDVTPRAAGPDRGVQDALIAEAIGWGADTVIVESAADWEARGVSLKPLLPDAASIVFYAVERPPVATLPGAAHRTDFGYSMSYVGRRCAFSLASRLEKLGYSSAPYGMSGVGAEPGRAVSAAVREHAERELFPGRQAFTCYTVTSAVLTPGRRDSCYRPWPAADDPAERIRRLARDLGADVVGIASAARVKALATQLKPIMDGEPILDARETGRLWLTSAAEVTQGCRRIQTPGDHLDGARSVVVLGVRIPQESAACLARPPAEAIGPYAFAQHQSHRQLRLIALQMVKILDGWGIHTAVTDDLCGAGSVIANPRGAFPSAFANRFAAVAAGLGTLTKGGFLRNPRFGTNLRTLAIVTDAPLRSDPLADLENLRAECDNGCSRCLSACTVGAFLPLAEVRLGRRHLTFAPIRQCRCDWALRYGLVPEEGVRYTGSRSNVPVPDQVTPEALAQGLAGRDQILKVRPCVAEMCLMACPYTRPQPA
ncbi:MAG: helix-turn-helix domain-containing protein [Lentisphaeria bacterium]|nr:helix-turn-helix domain-containing protein [Lentisphaeria bacterium]